MTHESLRLAAEFSSTLPIPSAVLRKPRRNRIELAFVVGPEAAAVWE